MPLSEEDQKRFLMRDLLLLQSHRTPFQYRSEKTENRNIPSHEDVKRAFDMIEREREKRR